MNGIEYLIKQYETSISMYCKRIEELEKDKTKDNSCSILVLNEGVIDRRKFIEQLKEVLND